MIIHSKKKNIKSHNEIKEKKQAIVKPVIEKATPVVSEPVVEEKIESEVEEELETWQED